MSAPAKHGKPKLPPPPIVLGILELNSRDRLRVAIDYYGGRHVVDVRKWFQRAPGGDLDATPKGITLHIARLPALAVLVNEALARARSEGVLPIDPQEGP
ncbi:MAG: PC4/YdbC family ssDNA-binding protein [Xanthobacteraceae bacterium]